MNENEELELLDLEAELSALRPTSVRPELMNQIQRSLPAESAPVAAPQPYNVINGRFSQYRKYGQVAAAALLAISSGLLLMVTRDGNSRNTGTARHEISPVSAVSQNQSQRNTTGGDLYSVGEQSSVTAPSDKGLIIEDGKPYHRFKYEVEDEQQWEDPDDGLKVRVRRPRTEQIFIPLQVF